MSRRPIGLSVPYRKIDILPPKFKTLTTAERAKFSKRIEARDYMHPDEIVYAIEKFIAEKNK